MNRTRETSFIREGFHPDDALHGGRWVPEGRWGVLVWQPDRATTVDDSTPPIEERRRD